MKVLKFGGASVKDAPSFKNILKVLNLYQGEQIFVVISAMGKITNALENLHDAYFNKKDTVPFLKVIVEYHSKVIDELFNNKLHPVNKAFSEHLKLLKQKLETEPSEQFNFEYDQIISYGELLSSMILSYYLTDCNYINKLIDARDIICTDVHYKEARIDWETTTFKVKEAFEMMENEGIRIGLTQGFIGSSPHKYTTTLGREGSDFTAAILGYALKAEEVIIWKDVPGVLNADPKQFSETIKIDYLSYLDAIELAYYGATIIHPKTIKPLENAGIPLKVKSFLEPQNEGTLIGGLCPAKKPVPSYIFKFNQILVSILPKDFSFIAENNLSNIFSILARYNIKVNLMQNSAVSFSICVDDNPFKTPKMLTELRKNFKVYYNKGLELVTIRHYNKEILKKVSKDKKILLEQRSRHTVQMVLDNNSTRKL